MFRNIINHPAHAAVGAVIGQILIPIPILGAYVGAEIGGHIGRVEQIADEHAALVQAKIDAESRK
jgi:hypothetical protein